MTKTMAQLRAVDYLRVSTEEQRKGYGITAAAKKTAKYITAKDWAHVDTFADEGFSGSLESGDRPHLKRLMELARQTPRPFDMVVVSEGRAIGRTGRAFWRWVWELEDMGVYVAVVKDDYDNSTASGRKKMRKDADYAEEERENIRDRTQGGIQEKAEEGGHAGGQARYGYRIENQGRKGEQKLVLDVCDGREYCSRTDPCSTIHGAVVLRRARALVVKYAGNFRKAALTLNVEGLFTRSGKPWTYPNLRSRLMDEDLLNARYVFRSAKNAALDAQGRPVWGESVTIDLEPLFTPEEVAELRRATSGRRRRPAVGGRVYTLSTRITSPCGGHYVGATRSSATTAHYRCTGKAEIYAGAGTCSCSQINAQGVEGWAWEQVCALLGDADRLRKMAEDWVGLTAGQKVNHIGRLADYDQQVAEQEAVINVTMAVAAKQAARRGLSPAEAEEAVEGALKPLYEELAQLETLRAEVAAWQADAEAAEGRAKDLQALAQMAHHRLEELTADQQKEFLHLLDVKITVTGPPPPMRKGVACSLAGWFREKDRLVPVLTDETWASVAPLMGAHRGLDPRQILAALLHKAHSGARWGEVEKQFGSSALRTYWRRWQASGLWDEIMSRLTDSAGVPVAAAHQLPPMHMEGVVQPGVILASEGHVRASDPSGSFHNVSYRFTAGVSA